MRIKLKSLKPRKAPKPKLPKAKKQDGEKKPKQKRGYVKFRKAKRFSPPAPENFFAQLPVELFLLVAEQLADLAATHPLALFNLAEVSKVTAARLASPDAGYVWENAYNTYLSTDAEARAGFDSLSVPWRDEPTARQSLALVVFKGCSNCGKAAVRKIYWEYGTRCCKDCLIKHTISDYRLEEVNINLNELHDFGLQYRTVDMYNPNSRHGDKSYTLNFYWEPGVTAFEKDKKRRANDKLRRQEKERKERIAADRQKEKAAKNKKSV